MTQLMERPAANGDQAEMVTRKEDRIPQTDSSQFAMLLDTGKFEHLWRVAKLFSSSELVPQHFRGKTENCFIATQMAMRLGVDPFMFLQNTHVVHGKPGMEAKLVIALINSSGLFKDPLEFDLSGTGDDRGCVCWAESKTTGKRIEGARVDLKLAKAEGWYGQNPKWKNMTDMMLMYRAAAFFGRLRCPERLMGMQTADEIEDIEPKLVTSTVVTSGQPRQSLAERMRPSLPDTQLTDEEAEKVLQEKAALANKTVDAPQPGNPSTSEEPGAGIVDLTLEWDAFKQECWDASEANGHTREYFEKKWKSEMVSARVVGKEHEMPKDKQAELYNNILNGVGHWAKLKGK
jgi:hypothetical protein